MSSSKGRVRWRMMVIMVICLIAKIITTITGRSTLQINLHFHSAHITLTTTNKNQPILLTIPLYHRRYTRHQQTATQSRFRTHRMMTTSLRCWLGSGCNWNRRIFSNLVVDGGWRRRGGRVLGLVVGDIMKRVRNKRIGL